jgi:hypothetical protein
MLWIIALLAIGYALLSLVLWRLRVNKRDAAALKASARLHEALAQKYACYMSPAELDELQRERWN